MKIIAPAVLSLIVACAACGQDQSVAPRERQGPSQQLDTGRALADYMAAQMDRGFSGVVLVNVDGETILHEAYDPAGHSINKDSCFWIASVSKMFAAATATLMHDRGALDLRAPVGTYLADVPADKKDITLHHLLTHTSGLDSTYVAEGVVDRAQATREILATPLQGPVGTSYLYSSDGYSLAAIIVETVAGRPFESVVQDTLLTPLELDSSGFWGFPVDESSCNLVPYGTGAGISESRSRPNYGFRGATGMRSNARDLLNWYQALFDESVIPARVRDLVLTPYVEKRAGVAYGYGWNIVETARGTRMVAHTGQDDLMTHVSYLYAFPDEGVVVILLTNAAMGLGGETLLGIRKRIFDDGA